MSLILPSATGLYTSRISAWVVLLKPRGNIVERACGKRTKRTKFVKIIKAKCGKYNEKPQHALLVINQTTKSV